MMDWTPPPPLACSLTPIHAPTPLLVPNAAAEEVEEMKEIDEIRQVAEELAEPEPSLFTST